MKPYFRTFRLVNHEHENETGCIGPIYYFSERRHKSDWVTVMTTCKVWGCSEGLSETIDKTVYWPDVNFKTAKVEKIPSESAVPESLWNIIYFWNPANIRYLFVCGFFLQFPVIKNCIHCMKPFFEFWNRDELWFAVKLFFYSLSRSFCIYIRRLLAQDWYSVPTPTFHT